MYDSIMVEEEPVQDVMEDVRLQDSIVGSGDMNSVGTPNDDGEETVVEGHSTGEIDVRREVKIEVEKAPSADSSFSEATNEDQLVDERFERDSLDEDLDEIMVLEDSE